MYWVVLQKLINKITILWGRLYFAHDVTLFVDLHSTMSRYCSITFSVTAQSARVRVRIHVHIVMYWTRVIILCTGQDPYFMYWIHCMDFISAHTIICTSISISNIILNFLFLPLKQIPSRLEQRGLFQHWGVYIGTYQIFTNVLCPAVEYLYSWHFFSHFIRIQFLINDFL
jgi:hypothetical protein